jgi:hypothetical protein
MLHIYKNYVRFSPTKLTPRACVVHTQMQSRRFWVMSPGTRRCLLVLARNDRHVPWI